MTRGDMEANRGTKEGRDTGCVSRLSPLMYPPEAGAVSEVSRATCPFRLRRRGECREPR